MGGRQREPFNAAPDTGKLAYRNPEFDPYPDERPTIYWPHPFWKDEDERLRYERAVHAAPPSQYPSLTLDGYLSEIVKLATGIRPQPGPRAMPKRGLL